MSDRLLTVLSYSGGTQSSCLLWMVILGIIPKPDSFVVLCADPGMENSETYKYNKIMRQMCIENDIYFEVVDGPSLYKDIISFSNGNLKRLDNPPYWLDKGKGKKHGKLKQSCTRRYKIEPITKAIRRILTERYNIHIRATPPADSVEVWIGFSADEVGRVKPSDRKYKAYRYPLIEMGYDKGDVYKFFKANNLPIPSRSMCNACFAHGLRSLKEMAQHRPDDYEQACIIDDAISDWHNNDKVKYPAYVSESLVRLRVLRQNNFDLGDEYKNAIHECNSGYCFL